LFVERLLLPHSLRAAQPHLNREELGESLIVIPVEKEEQQNIVLHITAETS
jgi:hypothetical protein